MLLWCSLGQIASSGIYILNSYRGMHFNYILGSSKTLNIYLFPILQEVKRRYISIVCAVNKNLIVFGES